MKRLAGKPFVLLGVNSDEDRKALKTVMEKEQLSWRSWWDGGSTEGPIATQWQVINWPTLFVLDANGVIRHIDAGGANANIEAVVGVVDSLLKELAAKGR